MKYLFLTILFFSFTSYADGLSRELTFQLNRSIVKVHSANSAGNHGVGSGVVVDKDHVVTNCHVIANANGIHITKYGTSHPPEELIADWHHDICILSFKYLNLDPVSLGSTDDVDYAKNVIAKSYGGNATRPVTSVGKVRDIFNYDGINIIQSSTWFSLGASGGGLFDEDGKLLGVTTFKTPGRGALYYSMPVEIVKDLLKNGERVKVTEQAKLPFWDEPPNKLPYFMKIVKPLFDEDWEELKKVSEKWIDDEDALEARFYLAKSLYHLKENDKSKEYVLEILNKKKNHSLAHQLLAKIYKEDGNDVKSNYHSNLYMELDNGVQEFTRQ
jgi:hypothetical protein